MRNLFAEFIIYSFLFGICEGAFAAAPASDNSNDSKAPTSDSTPAEKKSIPRISGKQLRQEIPASFQSASVILRNARAKQLQPTDPDLIGSYAFFDRAIANSNYQISKRSVGDTHLVLGGTLASISFAAGVATGIHLHDTHALSTGLAWLSGIAVTAGPPWLYHRIHLANRQHWRRIQNRALERLWAELREAGYPVPNVSLDLRRVWLKAFLLQKIDPILFQVSESAFQTENARFKELLQKMATDLNDKLPVSKLGLITELANSPRLDPKKLEADKKKFLELAETLKLKDHGVDTNIVAEPPLALYMPFLEGTALLPISLTAESQATTREASRWRARLANLIRFRLRYSETTSIHIPLHLRALAPLSIKAKWKLRAFQIRNIFLPQQYAELAAFERTETNLKSQLKDASLESTKIRWKLQLEDAQLNLARIRQTISAYRLELGALEGHIHNKNLVGIGQDLNRILPTEEIESGVADATVALTDLDDKNAAVALDVKLATDKEETALLGELEGRPLPEQVDAAPVAAVAAVCARDKNLHRREPEAPAAEPTAESPAPAPRVAAPIAAD